MSASPVRFTKKDREELDIMAMSGALSVTWGREEDADARARMLADARVRFELAIGQLEFLEERWRTYAETNEAFRRYLETEAGRGAYPRAETRAELDARYATLAASDTKRAHGYRRLREKLTRAGALPE